VLIVTAVFLGLLSFPVHAGTRSTALHVPSQIISVRLSHDSTPSAIDHSIGYLPAFQNQHDLEIRETLLAALKPATGISSVDVAQRGQQIIFFPAIASPDSRLSYFDFQHPRLRSIPIAGDIARHLKLFNDPDKSKGSEGLLARVFDAVDQHQSSDDIIYNAKRVNLYKKTKKSWIRDPHYTRLVDEHLKQHGPYLGRLPGKLVALFHSSQDAAIAAISHIANTLPLQEMDDQWSHAEFIGDIPAPVIITPAGKSNDSIFYKIQLINQCYLLRISNRGDVSREFRTLTFLSAKGARDVIKPFMADLGSDGSVPWMISEYIPDSPPLAPREFNQRGDRTMANVAKRKGLYLPIEVIRVNSIVISAGDINHRSELNSPITDAEYNDRLLLYKNYAKKVAAIWKKWMTDSP
jgi:hypothetical protein